MSNFSIRFTATAIAIFAATGVAQAAAPQSDNPQAREISMGVMPRTASPKADPMTKPQGDRTLTAETQASVEGRAAAMRMPAGTRVMGAPARPMAHGPAPMPMRGTPD